MSPSTARDLSELMVSTQDSGDDKPLSAKNIWSGIS